MKDEDPTEFVAALNRLCAEANCAISLAPSHFADSDLRIVRRELARCMEIVDGRITPLLQKRYPKIRVIPDFPSK